MARNRNNRNNEQQTANPEVEQMDKNDLQIDTPTEDVADEVVAPEVVAPIVAAEPARLPYALARETNFAKSANPEELVAAGVVKTAKGTNPTKSRVYGYDNGTEGGKVDKTAKIAIVPGASDPAGVTAGQWQLLKQYADKPVQTAYDNAVTSRTVRRAYRAGAIRFVK